MQRNAACKKFERNEAQFHNSENVFRYFASAVNSNYSTKCNRKDLYAICSY